MALAKHIQVARTEGAKAGYRAYMATSAPTARERQATIRAAGNAKAQFDAYCAMFTDELGDARLNHGATAAHSESQRESLRERLARMLLGGTLTDDALLSALTDEGVGVVVEAEPVKSEADLLIEQAQALIAKADALKAKPATRKPKVAPQGEKYAPAKPNEDASSGRLWRLNEAGLLSIRSTAGKPITQGAAHKMLSAIL